MKPPHVQLGLPKPRMRLARMPAPGDKRPRKARDEREERYQRMVAEYLDWALPADVVYFAVPNGGWRSKKTAGMMKATGAKAGVADLIFVYRGKHHELELKCKPGGQSEDQKAHEARVLAAGGRYGIAWDTLEAVIDKLQEWEIPIRARPRNL